MNIRIIICFIILTFAGFFLIIGSSLYKEHPEISIICISLNIFIFLIGLIQLIYNIILDHRRIEVNDIEVNDIEVDNIPIHVGFPISSGPNLY